MEHELVVEYSTKKIPSKEYSSELDYFMACSPQSESEIEARSPPNS